MVFLFFASSLSPLEPKLAPLKDLEEIGDIWEISGKSEISEKSVGASATLREIFQMLPIFFLDL